jgi:TatD DNase family protein
MLVDSHCHLDDSDFDADRQEVIERARAAGIEAMLAVGSEACLRLAEAYPDIYATLGIHPHEASKADGAALDRLAEQLTHPKVLAVGEIGLDYHYDFSPRPLQREVFRAQLAIAKQAGLPVIIHTREAWDDTLDLLRESGVASGIMHCFSEGPDEAAQALELGFHISFAGILTFPKARRIQDAARMVPPDRLLVETDAPYLAPVPRRGKRNEPAFVVETARKLAALRGETFEKIAVETTRNFRSVILK